MSAKVDLKPWHEGETWIIDFYCRDAFEKPIPLTGATIHFLVAHRDELVIELVSPSPDITVTDAAAGMCTVKITPDLTVGAYDYEFWVVTASGEETAQAEGKILIKKSIRRRASGA